MNAAAWMSELVYMVEVFALGFKRPSEKRQSFGFGGKLRASWARV